MLECKQWIQLVVYIVDTHHVFLHKAINDQSRKLKNSWLQNYLFHVCILIFLTFTWELSVWALFFAYGYKFT